MELYLLTDDGYRITIRTLTNKTGVQYDMIDPEKEWHTYKLLSVITELSIISHIWASIVTGSML